MDWPRLPCYSCQKCYIGHDYSYRGVAIACADGLGVPHESLPCLGYEKSGSDMRTDLVRQYAHAQSKRQMKIQAEKDTAERLLEARNARRRAWTARMNPGPVKNAPRTSDEEVIENEMRKDLRFAASMGPLGKILIEEWVDSIE